jgi:ferredoxin--NADP+ reductase
MSATPAASKSLGTETVLAVRHWTDSYFSFTTTRDDGLRFENGQFVMIGLMVNDKPLLRAYSIASANWEEQLEFFSIKVPDGPLTSRLQHLKEGDEILISRKPTGTLLISDLHPGRTLILLSTGTGLAPFLATIKDPDTYERFEHVVVTHGVRGVADLAYRDYIERAGRSRHHRALRAGTRMLASWPRRARRPDRPAVEVSPSCSGAFSAILRRMRRMILPERVFGRPGAHWMKSGEAIGPISLRTQATSSLRSSSLAAMPALSVT